MQQTITSVISGTPSSKIPFFIPSKAISTFNYPSLLLNNFDVDECPAGSMFLERPETFYEQHKYLLIFGIGTVAALLFFAFMSYRIRTLKTLTETQQQQFEMSRELTRLFENMLATKRRSQTASNRHSWPI